MGAIILLVGKSGSGKTMIAEKAKERFGLKSIQSYTTRPKRYPDETGHIFVSDDEFNSLENLVAYTEFNGYKYAATAKQVEDNDIYVIDPDGIKYFKDNYKGDKKIITVWLYATKEQRYERMLARGDTPEAAKERLAYDDIKFGSDTSIADWVIMNDIDDYGAAATENLCAIFCREVHAI